MGTSFEDAVWASRLDSTPKLVLLCVVRHLDTYGECRAEADVLAERCGCGEKTIRTTLATLVRLGWLLAEQRPGRPSIYRLGTPEKITGPLAPTSGYQAPRVRKKTITPPVIFSGVRAEVAAPPENFTGPPAVAPLPSLPSPPDPPNHPPTPAHSHTHASAHARDTRPRFTPTTLPTTWEPDSDAYWDRLKTAGVPPIPYEREHVAAYVAHCQGKESGCWTLNQLELGFFRWMLNERGKPMGRLGGAGRQDLDARRPAPAADFGQAARASAPSSGLMAAVEAAEREAAADAARKAERQARNNLSTGLSP